MTVSDVVVALTAFGIRTSRPEIGEASRGSSRNSTLRRGVCIFEVQVAYWLVLLVLLLLLLCRGFVSLASCILNLGGCYRYREVVEEYIISLIDRKEMISFLVNEEADMRECSACSCE